MYRSSYLGEIRSVLNLVLCLALALVWLTGCAGKQQDPTPHNSGLPSPLDFPRTTSAEIPPELFGSEFLPTFFNRVDAAGTLGHYTPDPGLGTPGLAYGAYQFDAAGRTGAAELNLLWHTPPATGGYIGLSDWAADAWEWFPLGEPGTPLDIEILENYVHADGRLLALVVLDQIGDADLSLLRLSQDEPEPYWRVAQLSATPGVVKHITLLELGGMPAVVYWRDGLDEDPPTSRIVIKRALDEFGEAWGPPQVLWNVPQDGGHTGHVHKLLPLMVQDRLTMLTEILGDDTEFLHRIYYLRAVDAEATALDAPVLESEHYEALTWLIDAAVVAEQMTALQHDSFGEWYFVTRANEVSGMSWHDTTLDEIDGMTGNRPNALTTASDLAAVFYPFRRTDIFPGEPYELRFRRAINMDTSGAWADPVVVIPEPNGITSLQAIALSDGRPAFMRGSGGSYQFWAAADVLGDSWPAGGEDMPIATADTSQHSLERIGLLPAVGYSAGDPPALHYVAADDILGATWATPQLVYDGAISQAPSMREFGGWPAMATAIPSDGSSVYPIFFIYR